MIGCDEEKQTDLVYRFLRSASRTLHSPLNIQVRLWKVVFFMVSSVFDDLLREWFLGITYSFFLTVMPFLLVSFTTQSLLNFFFFP